MDKFVIDYCRRYYGIPDGHATDAEIAKQYAGSFGEVMGNLSVAMNGLHAAVIGELPQWVKRMMDVED